MNTDFVLSQTDSRPMYLQIMEQVNQRVALGDLPPGTKLPSIRELAVALKVSVITVKRAYLELERQGLIVTRQGRGSWISDGVPMVSLQQDELAGQMAKAVELAKSMGVSQAELEAMLARLWDSGANR